MLKVDQEKCIGCGLCAGMCPESFVMNSEGNSEAIKPEVTDCAKNAANNCPVGAITTD